MLEEREREREEEVGRSCRHPREAVSESVRKGGGEESRRQTGWQRRAPMLTWRDGTESDSRPHLLPETEQ